MSGNKSITVGLLNNWDINNPNVSSGTIYRSVNALRDAGVDIVDLSNHDVPSITFRITHIYSKVIDIFVPAKFTSLRINLKELMGKITSTLLAPFAKTIMIRHAQKMSASGQQKYDQHKEKIDLLLGMCTNTIFYDLKTDKPIIYASDTTAELVNRTYPEFIKLSKQYHQACDIIEKSTFDRCAYFLPAAKCAQASAIEFYQMPEQKAPLIEFGAHITPDHEVPVKTPPDKSDIQLCLVAADPVRKQLPLCIKITEALNQLGWNARLHYIGPDHSSLKQTDVVQWHGRLQLSDEIDRAKHQRVMEDSHWMLLPSTAEAFGIAPCEAAHFAVPSVVTDVGGLPTVVQDGITGLVMSIDDEAEIYAQAIIEISNEPTNYLTMSKAALERAQNTLSWPVWAKRVKAVMEQALAESEDDKSS